MNQSIIDINVAISQWPTRRLPNDETRALATMLRSHGVSQAWVGSLDGVLHKDLSGVNQRLADECKAVGEIDFLPVGSINPIVPDWQEDVRRCVEDHRMRALRVHPNYHGYTLDHPSFAEFLKLAEARNLIVMLPIQMEDERVMHPLLRVKPVEIEPLKKLVPEFPRLKLVLLNAGKGLLGKSLPGLVRAGQVYVDIAHFDGLAVMEDVLRDIPLERILFGSHSPLFYFESALLKLKECQLNEHARQAICFNNAKQLI